MQFSLPLCIFVLNFTLLIFTISWTIIDNCLPISKSLTSLLQPYLFAIFSPVLSFRDTLCFIFWRRFNCLRLLLPFIFLSVNAVCSLKWLILIGFNGILLEIFGLEYFDSLSHTKYELYVEHSFSYFSSLICGYLLQIFFIYLFNNITSTTLKIISIFHLAAFLQIFLI